MTYRTELLDGFETEVDYDPDSRTWSAAIDKYSTDKHPGYLPPRVEVEGGTPGPKRHFILDDDGDCIEEADAESPLVTGGHQGELWEDEYDGDYVVCDGRAILKPASPYIEWCECGWPLPIRWQWSQGCEFGQSAWRSIDPAMEQVLDDDPLLYRVTPWLWTLCRCNGCLSRRRSVGRPPGKCTECQRDANNARRRNTYASKIIIEFTGNSVDKSPDFVA